VHHPQLEQSNTYSFLKKEKKKKNPKERPQKTAFFGVKKNRVYFRRLICLPVDLTFKRG